MSNDNGARGRAEWGMPEALAVFARRHGYSIDMLPSGEIPLGQTWTCSIKRRRLWITPEMTAADASKAVAWMRRFPMRGSDALFWSRQLPARARSPLAS